MLSSTRALMSSPTPREGASGGRALIPAPAPAASASGLSGPAVRRRDWSAQLLVAIRPRRSTTPPQAASVHQPPGLADERPAPTDSPAADVTIAPTTATPSVWPN